MLPSRRPPQPQAPELSTSSADSDAKDDLKLHAGRRSGALRVLQALLIATIIFGVWARFDRPGYKALWFDEAVSLARAFAGDSKTFARKIERRLVRQPLTFEEVASAFTLGVGTSGEILRNSLNEPHLPVYYLALRGWLTITVETIGSARVFSAVLAIALILIAPSLVHALFDLSAPTLVNERRLAGLFAASGVALSPFYVTYSHEVRMYTLFALSGALSTLFLLRALKTNRTRDYILYCATLTIGLFTHILFVTVAVSHFLLGLRFRRTVNVSAVQFIGLLLVSPWYYALVTAGNDRFHFSQRGMPFIEYLAEFSWAVSTFIVDLPLGVPVEPIVENSGLTAISLLALATIALSIIELVRTRERRELAVTLFILGATPILTLGVADLLTGGTKLTVSRYMTGAVLPLLVLNAVAVAFGITSKRTISRVLGASVLFAGIGLGGASYLVTRDSRTFGKPPASGLQDFPAMAEALQREVPAVVFPDAGIEHLLFQFEVVPKALLVETPLRLLKPQQRRARLENHLCSRKVLLLDDPPTSTGTLPMRRGPEATAWSKFPVALKPVWVGADLALYQVVPNVGVCDTQTPGGLPQATL